MSAIIRLRHAGLPAWQIARRVGPPRSTVSVVLRRVDLGRLVVPSQRVRYEWLKAVDWLHRDIKALGRFRAIGHRIHFHRQVRSPWAGSRYVARGH